MYEMPVIYVFGGWGFRLAFLYIGVIGNGMLSLAFCPYIVYRPILKIAKSPHTVISKVKVSQC